MLREMLDWLQQAAQHGVQLDQLASPGFALLAAFGLGLLFGAVPAGGAELLAIAAGAVTPRSMIVPLLLSLTFGHVLGKLFWYWLGRFGSGIRHARVQAWVSEAHRLAKQHPRLEVGVLLMAAFASVPPFQLAAVAAGVVRAPVWIFLGTAFLGRLARFAVVAAVPGVVGFLA
jgi:membrane protein YqaA with SNARE-associated domain